MVMSSVCNGLRGDDLQLLLSSSCFLKHATFFFSVSFLKFVFYFLKFIFS